jgi:hypothetical protein
MDRQTPGESKWAGWIQMGRHVDNTRIMLYAEIKPTNESELGRWSGRQTILALFLRLNSSYLCDNIFTLRHLA